MNRVFLAISLFACACPNNDSGSATDVGSSTFQIETQPLPSTSTSDDSGTGTSSTVDDTTSTTEMAVCDLSEGKPFGPCHSDSTCDAGIVCMIHDTGRICEPPCFDCMAQKYQACVEDLSVTDEFFCNTTDLCEIPCVTDEQCENGTRCDIEHGKCVWV